jgi:hypothetical protein
MENWEQYFKTMRRTSNVALSEKGAEQIANADR